MVRSLPILSLLLAFPESISLWLSWKVIRRYIKSSWIQWRCCSSLLALSALIRLPVLLALNISFILVFSLALDLVLVLGILNIFSWGLVRVAWGWYLLLLLRYFMGGNVGCLARDGVIDLDAFAHRRRDDHAIHFTSGSSSPSHIVALLLIL